MMIEVTTDEKQVVVKFTGEGPLRGWTFSFTDDPSCQWQAKLLARQLDRQIAEGLERIKRQFYRLGVKHARAKRRLLNNDEFLSDWRFDEQFA